MKLMERLNKAKKNKKGFTLVELIVVIVILGILAAILVPSFVKYMDDAKEAQAKVEARSIYIAANYVYAKNKYDTEPTKQQVRDQAAISGLTDEKFEIKVIASTKEMAIQYKPNNNTTIEIPEKSFTP